MKKEKTSTEQAILNAAEEVFLTKGYAAAKTTEIAGRAGVNHAMLHYYFRTKASLFERVFEEKLTLFASSFFGVFDTELPFREKVRTAVGRHYDLLAANPRLPMFIMGEMLADDERRARVLHVIRPQLLHLQRDIQREIDEEVEKGLIPRTLSIDALINTVALNIYSVTFAGIVAGNNPQQYATMLAHRREINIELIMKGLGL